MAFHIPRQNHYITHREVIHDDRNTTKVRVVNDASAKRTGTSLNDYLYPGTSLKSLIFHLFCSLSLYKVAIFADFEKNS